MESPVLFIVFARPECARRVFKVIRRARPKRLYVAADGPREDKTGEVEKCQQVRDLVREVDWECELSTLFRSTNLGCRFGPQGAIDWFLEEEREGIILEEDCVPELDFFEYCDWALENYRDRKEVWHISGNNFSAPRSLYKHSAISFTSLAQVWGWATWRDRWGKYSGNPFYAGEYTEGRAGKWKLTSCAKWCKLRHLEKLKSGLDTWDFQWQITVLNHNGLCVTSRSNLITNVGDEVGATHTANDRRGNLPTSSLNRHELRCVNPRHNRGLTSWYERKMGLRNYKAAIQSICSRGWHGTKRWIREFASGLLFRGATKIVVASSGRSGSTMLFNAIATGFVLKRFGLSRQTWLGWLLVDLAKIRSVRLAHVVRSAIPLHKTHDVFESAYENAAKYVFVYGDPLESACSVEKMVNENGRIWLDEHLYHLRSQGSMEDLYEKDILNYRRQLETWSKAGRENVFIICYEDLWARTDELAEFLGFEVPLTPKRSRQAKLPPGTFNKALFEELRAMMADLREATSR